MKRGYTFSTTDGHQKTPLDYARPNCSSCIVSKEKISETDNAPGCCWANYKV